METKELKYQFNEEKHIHSLNGKPLTGTSSVGDVLFKPLNWWASGKCAEKFGWVNPKYSSDVEVVEAADMGLKKIKAMNLNEYVKFLQRAYRAHWDFTKKAADKGTDLHAELEAFVKGVMGLKPKRTYDDRIKPFIDWSNENVKRFIYSEAHCFDEDLWIGGISDTGVELNDGKKAIIDFKSSKDAYLTQFVQCAGYAIQIEKNGLWSKDGKHNKIVWGKFDSVIVVPFGAKEVNQIVRHDLEGLKKGFEYSVYLYRLLKIEEANKKN